MRRGQSTVEYMITLSVVVIAIVAAMVVFEDTLVINTIQLSDGLASEILVSQGVQRN